MDQCFLDKVKMSLSGGRPLSTDMELLSKLMNDSLLTISLFFLDLTKALAFKFSFSLVVQNGFLYASMHHPLLKTVRG